MAQTMLIIWIGVTVKRWPNDAVASETSFHSLETSVLWNRPLLSPGRSMPVLSSMPNALVKS